MSAVDPSLPDAEVIARSLDDPDVFGLLFDRHLDAVHAHLARRGGRDAADDLAGEVFRVAFERRRRFDGRRASALPWLYGISANVLRRHRRDAFRRGSAYRRLGPVAATPDPADRTAATVDAREQRPRLEAALRSLPARDREPLLLHVWEGLSYDEVAEALDVPVGTVRSRLHRARRRLRAVLGAADAPATSRRAPTAPSRPA